MVVGVPLSAEQAAKVVEAADERAASRSLTAFSESEVTVLTLASARAAAAASPSAAARRAAATTLASWGLAAEALSAPATASASVLSRSRSAVTDDRLDGEERWNELTARAAVSTAAHRASARGASTLAEPLGTVVVVVLDVVVVAVADLEDEPQAPSETARAKAPAPTSQ